MAFIARHEGACGEQSIINSAHSAVPKLRRSADIFAVGRGAKTIEPVVFLSPGDYTSDEIGSALWLRPRADDTNISRADEDENGGDGETPLILSGC